MTAEGGSVAEGARLAPWRPTDDPAEVARRRYELAAIEARVNDAEAEWLDALERNAAFRARYLTAVGSLLQAVLDARATLAARRAAEAPNDERMRDSAEDTRRTADEGRTEQQSFSNITSEARVHPSDEVKHLYRQVARRLHPDLAEDDADRVRRTTLMAEANAAYAIGDEARLRELLAGATAVQHNAPGPQSESTMLLEKIARAWRRLDQISIGLRELHSSDWWQLMQQVEAADAAGNDLLTDVRESLAAELADLRTKLAEPAGRRDQSFEKDVSQLCN